MLIFCSVLSWQHQGSPPNCCVTSWPFRGTGSNCPQELLPPGELLEEYAISDNLTAVGRSHGSARPADEGVGLCSHVQSSVVSNVLGSGCAPPSSQSPFQDANVELSTSSLNATSEQNNSTPPPPATISSVHNFSSSQLSLRELIDRRQHEDQAEFPMKNATAFVSPAETEGLTEALVVFDNSTTSSKRLNNNLPSSDDVVDLFQTFPLTPCSRSPMIVLSQLNLSDVSLKPVDTDDDVVMIDTPGFHYLFF